MAQAGEQDFQGTQKRGFDVVFLKIKSSVKWISYKICTQLMHAYQTHVLK